MHNCGLTLCIGQIEAKKIMGLEKTIYKISGRSEIPPFIAMDIMKEAHIHAAQGKDIAHLSVGQPSIGAPQRVIDAARRALDSDILGYTDALGLPALRERIARHYQEFYGISIKPERVAVTTGSSAGFLLAFLAAFDAGDQVALGQPGYPPYFSILKALGIKPALIDVGADTHFQPNAAHIADLHSAIGLDGILIASPANPTGSILNEAALRALVDCCASRRIRIVSDEIYHGITYQNPAPSILSLTSDAIVVNSFSKYFCMTGWRLGWMILPEDLVRPVERLGQSFYISPPTLSQQAGIAAFDCYDELNDVVKGYGRNRDIMLNELPKAGFKKFAPAEGAFYIYADVSDLTDNSVALCERMLAEAGVAATPGVDFDQIKGRHFIRFSYARSEAEIIRACARLASWKK
jgi:aspartate/methionine/tyrosine aminotransferase